MKILGWLLPVLLAGCATLEPITAPVTTPSPPLVQAFIPSFEINGRLSVRHDNEGFSGNLRWRHVFGEDEFVVLSPLGQGVARVTQNAQGATLQTADGQMLYAPDAESLTQQALGFRLPLDSLPWAADVEKTYARDPFAPVTQRKMQTAHSARPPDVVRTAGGVGALLAAALLTLLAARRVRQQRRRHPGQRIPMPPADLASTEQDLRLVENPDALARVDQALRTLSALLGEAGRSLPPLRLARLHAQQLELYLAEPAMLPAPFAGTADPTVWTLDSDALLLPTAELANVPAPYPSLVTIGHDLDDAHVLVDLEHLGALAVNGDDDRSLAVLAALAAELATSRWADDLQVTLVGCLPTLPTATPALSTTSIADYLAKIATIGTAP